MLILHALSSLDTRSGGPVVALRGLARAQQAQGLKVRILASHLTGESIAMADEFRSQGIQVITCGPTWDRRVKFHPGLAAAARKALEGAHAVHIHGLWEEVQWQASRAASRASVPAIIRPCGMLDPWSLSQGGLHKKLYLRLRLRRMLDAAAALHFTTNAERDLTAPLALRSPAIVEPNGLDLEDFADPLPRGAFRARYPQIPAGAPIVLFLSRLHFKKGLDLLIPAFAEVRRTHPDAWLVLAGPDEDGYRAEVERLIAAANLQNCTLLPGLLSGRDKVAAYADATLFVLPSRQENFGNVVVESMAAGTPVVVSDQVNLCDAVKETDSGCVVPLDTGALARELSAWLGDADRRTRAAAAARAAAGTYAWPEIARRWQQHYQQLPR